MNKRRWVIIALSFASMIGVSIWIAKASKVADATPVLVPWWAHLLALTAVAIEITSRALKIGWSAAALRIPVTFSTSLRTCVGGDLGAAITPARTGAEPARFLILAEGGVKPADALMILFMELFLEMLSLAFIAFVLAFVFQGAGPVLGTLLGMIGGYAGVVLGLGAFGVILAHRNAHGPPPDWALRLRLHAGRWRVIQLQLRQLRTSIEHVQHARVGMMAASFVASLVHVGVRLTILPLIVFSLGDPNIDAHLANLVLWPLAILYGGAIAPAPGGGGLIELSFRQTLRHTIPRRMFGASLNWWRFYTYWLYIVLGSIAAGHVVLRALRKRDLDKLHGHLHVAVIKAHIFETRLRPRSCNNPRRGQLLCLTCLAP